MNKIFENQTTVIYEKISRTDSTLLNTSHLYLIYGS